MNRIATRESLAESREGRPVDAIGMATLEGRADERVVAERPAGTVVVVKGMRRILDATGDGNGVRINPLPISTTSAVFVPNHFQMSLPNCRR
jgi:hypothetical protein